MTAATRKEAWSIAAKLMPTDYQKSESKSRAAGYDVYESTAEGHREWISDLGTRLEVNLESGSVNIWISENASPAAALDLADEATELKVAAGKLKAIASAFSHEFTESDKKSIMLAVDTSHDTYIYLWYALFEAICEVQHRADMVEAAATR